MWISCHFVILLTFACVSLATRGVATSLVGNLLQNYPQYMRPVKKIETVTNVTHRLLPIQIVDVDERNQILTLKVWVRLMWRDEYLTWNASEHAGIDSVIIPVDKIWQPDITLYGSVTKKFERHLDTDVTVESDGSVLAPQPIIYEATCAIDATYFPFDEQRCELKFGSWSYDGASIDLYPAPSSGSLESYVPNGEWDVLKFPSVRHVLNYTCCPNPFIDVTYTVHIRRRSMFYIFNLVLPAILLFILVLVGFYLPSDCGERMTLFVTSMLALMVFLTLASDYMPPTSESTPYIQRYLLTTIGMVAVSSLLTAFTVNMHFQPPGCPSVPGWVRTLVFQYLSVLVGMESQTRKFLKKSPPASNKEVFINNPDVDETACHVLVTEKCGNKNGTKSVLPSTDVDDPKVHENIVHEWQTVAKVVDRVFLLTYTFVFLSLSIGFLSYLHVRGLNNHLHD
ncbi:neuronal acetylcholine receptor subunit alpha-10-like [Ptychodera flava]|uniref:neuronal acetylcholine receptor subunit alpha-10-like n=1 Tax=Ptychodera flava TaxID=63121 RepID=UPI00396A6425